jgi:hypothetical protein
MRTLKLCSMIDSPPRFQRPSTDVAASQRPSKVKKSKLRKSPARDSAQRAGRSQGSANSCSRHPPPPRKREARGRGGLAARLASVPSLLNSVARSERSGKKANEAKARPLGRVFRQRPISQLNEVERKTNEKRKKGGERK